MNARMTAAAAVAVVIAALIGLVGVLVTECEPPPEPTGEILAPEPGAEVAASFTASGTLKSIPDDGHVWLAIQRGNYLYPKEPEIPSDDREWVQQFEEVSTRTGEDESFSLVLLLADATGQARIEDWLDAGRTSGDYEGVSADLEGLERLDVITGLTVAPTPTTADTTTTSSRPRSFPLEAEDAAEPGTVMNRSSASGERTLLLRDGQAVTLPFEVDESGLYSFAIRYSNDNLDDGPFETVAVLVDGQSVSEFQAEDTGSGGFGWDAFVDSPVFGPTRLGPGDHDLTISVAGGDGYGIEIDVVSLS